MGSHLDEIERAMGDVSITKPGNNNSHRIDRSIDLATALLHRRQQRDLLGTMHLLPWTM